MVWCPSFRSMTSDDARPSDGPSIGIANAARNRSAEGPGPVVHGDNAASELLRAADAAMYVAKANGGDRYAHSGELSESPDEGPDVNFHAVA